MLSKAAKILTITILGTTVLSLKPGEAALQNDNIANKIKSNNEQFSELLNAKGDPKPLVEFLHNKISHDAEITMSITDSAHQEAKDMEMKISKEDYINSYIYGPRQIRDYHADMLTLKVDVDGQSVTTKEILTESGFTINPHDYADKGRAFTSTTSCVSEHFVEQDGAIKLESAKCKTEIRYEESV